MSGVLDQPRDVTIGDHVQQFRNFADLGGMIEMEIEVIQAGEAELESNPDEAAAIWTHIAKHATYLEAMVSAQEQWLAEHDAVLAQESRDLRRTIRNLTSSSYKGGEEGGP